MTIKKFAVRALALAVTSLPLVQAPAYAAPAGGVVMDGMGSISQNDGDTRIDQGSQRLALEWDSFNVGASERVEFVQPGSDAIALNHILDNNGSQILGRIDANGHVVLVNPNGVFFGRNATINVGGLVASGLSIDSDDFMNGDLLFAAIDGAAGTVVNRGLINAATGGNVALLGKSVANHGLISADLGHIALAAGAEAVVTFDDAGLIGVRIDRETLASEVGGTYAVNNTGTIEAAGGKILLNASVSADLFSEAVNHGELNGTTEAILHSDGSFSLGAGNSVVNAGILDVSTAAGAGDAGYVVVTGDIVEHRGSIDANAAADDLAGQVYLESTSQTRLAGASRTRANADITSGKVRVSSDNLLANPGAQVATTGHTFFDVYSSARLPAIHSEHLRISSIGSVRQAGAARVSGSTHLVGAAGFNLRLVQADNDFNTLTADADHTSYMVIIDSNDIALGEIEVQDSTVHLTAAGADATISQLAGSHLGLDASSLYMTAPNILLGGDGASTSAYMSQLQLTFGNSIATNDSIELHPFDPEIPANAARILARDLEFGDLYLDLRGDREIDLNANLDVFALQLNIEAMTGRTASLLSSFAEVYQSGPITLSGGLTWNSYIAQLDNPGNDIAFIQGSGGPAFGYLSYVDSNDLQIRDLVTDAEVAVSLTSVGAGASLSQAANTTLDADYIHLAADSISLGAQGSSQLVAVSTLDIDFGASLLINGPWAIYGYSPAGPWLDISGDEGINRLEFGEFATNDSFADAGDFTNLSIDLGAGDDLAIFNSAFLTNYEPQTWSQATLHMGAGNDSVTFNGDVTIPLTLGAGSDTLMLGDAATLYQLEDFDPAEDQIVAP